MLDCWEVGGLTVAGIRSAVRLVLKPFGGNGALSVGERQPLPRPALGMWNWEKGSFTWSTCSSWASELWPFGLNSSSLDSVILITRYFSDSVVFSHPCFG